MRDAEYRVLFYSLLAIIVAVNAILAYGLFRHFALNEDVKSLPWLLATFGAELVSAAVLGWRTVLAQSKDSEGGSVRIIQRVNYGEPETDPDVVKKETGRGFLVRARQAELSASQRANCVRRALDIFASIPPSSSAYLAALYDMATGYRVLGDYAKSRKQYEVVRHAVEECRETLGEDQYLRRIADIEMMIGNTWAEEGKIAEARDQYLKAWTIDPHDFNRTLNLRDLAIRAGDTQEAEVWDERLRSHAEYAQLAPHLLTISRQNDDTRDPSRGHGTYAHATH